MEQGGKYAGDVSVRTFRSLLIELSELNEEVHFLEF